MKAAAKMTLLALGAALALPSLAQEAVPGRRQRPAAPGGQGAPADREAMIQQWQARRNDQIREQLQATDEEWAVVQPLITKVNEIRRAGLGQAMGGRGGGRAPGAPAEGGAAPAAPWGEGTEASALRAALAEAGSTPETLAARLTALRDARLKQEAELKKAREELRAVLTLRQEAQLVLNGLLD